jgi:hypothetical protein
MKTVNLKTTDIVDGFQRISLGANEAQRHSFTLKKCI